MVLGRLPPRKIAPRSGSAFGLGLALELGLGGQFSMGAVFLEPISIADQLRNFFCNFAEISVSQQGVSTVCNDSRLYIVLSVEKNN